MLVPEQLEALQTRLMVFCKCCIERRYASCPHVFVLLYMFLCVFPCVSVCGCRYLFVAVYILCMVVLTIALIVSDE